VKLFKPGEGGAGIRLRAFLLAEFRVYTYSARSRGRKRWGRWWWM